MSYSKGANHGICAAEEGARIPAKPQCSTRGASLASAEVGQGFLFLGCHFGVAAGATRVDPDELIHATQAALGFDTSLCMSLKLAEIHLGICTLLSVAAATAPEASGSMKHQSLSVGLRLSGAHRRDGRRYPINSHDRSHLFCKLTSIDLLGGVGLPYSLQRLSLVGLSCVM